MKNNLFNVSSQLELPLWWVESIAIEYLNCREFAARDEIWTFNFDLISQENLIETVKTRKIVISSPLIQYPSLNKSLLNDLKNYFLGLDDDNDYSVIEGYISLNNFPEEVEFLDFWDPKLSFSECFQVYDDGKFWQWKIAESTPLKGKLYNKWVSSLIDLKPINDIDVKLRKIRNHIIKPGKPGNHQFKVEVEEFYEELKKVRIEIIPKLWKIHQKKKKSKIMKRF